MTTFIKYLPPVVKTITRDQLKRYAEVSGDHNPLHLDDRFAETTQFGGIIAHGMLTLAFISEMMLAAFGRCWLESGSLKVRFKGAAYLGDRVETWGQVTQEIQQDIQQDIEQDIQRDTQGDTQREKRPGAQLRVVCSVGARDCRNQREIISGSATVSVDL